MPDNLVTRRRRDTFRLVADALARGIAPDPIIEPATWAAENLIVADGPYAGQKWSPDLTPYVSGILNMLAVDGPHTRVTVRKSAQTGLTECGIAWVGSIIDKTPAQSMIVFPTISSARDFNREKLAPCIEATPCLKRKVLQHRSRSASASTALNKRFPGGALILTGANSASDLRSKTVRFLFCDEIDEWPLDLDGQGDPMEMAYARQTAFHATSDYCAFEISTPRVKGMSRIDRAFEEGDQRYWHVPCPHCGEFQRLVFGGKDTPYGLKFSKEWPTNAHYICAHCGAEIAHYQKAEMVRAGKWVITQPEPGRHPSFHVDSLISLLTTWDKVAEKFLEAQNDPERLKTFVNLWLGEAWEERGEAPEWNRLYARREDWPARQIPPGGVILTGAADVQSTGIYYEVVAWGRDRQSWSIDIGFLEGDTADPANPVWVALGQVCERHWPDSYGNTWQVDAFAVDSGFNSNTVYQWCRTHARAMAIKGEPGWHRAAISSSPTSVDINLSGRRIRRGARLWHIGTWPLKAELYANLRKDGRRDGAELDPPGFAHFSEAVHDDQYFRQLTAEYLKERQSKGRHIKEWVATGPNHFHDCRIYNMALAVHKGVGVMSDAEWHEWEALRCRPRPEQQGDLLALMNKAPPSRPPDPTHTQSPSRSSRRSGGFVHKWSSS